MYTAAIVVQVIGIIVLLYMIYFLITVEGTFERKMMLATGICVLVQNYGYLIELLTDSPEKAIVAIQLEYFGCLWTTLLFMIFIMHFCEKKVNVLLRLSLILLNIVILGTLLTNSMHKLYYSDYYFVSDTQFPHIVLNYGPMFYVFLVDMIVTNSISVFSVISFYKKTKKNHGNKKKRATLKFLAMAPLAPFASLFLHMLKIGEGYDSSPICILIVTCITIFWLHKENLFDIVATAKMKVIDELENAFIIIDDKMCVLELNNAAKKMFPSIRKIEIGQSIRDCLEIPESVFTGEPVSEFLCRDMYFESHVTKLYDNDNELKGYAALIFDVTSKHDYIENLVKMKEAADRANQSKSDFLANVSHEIRTPMNAIIGMSELILEESIGRKVYDFACDIKIASQNLLLIINDILDISKVEAGRFEIIPMEYYTEVLFKDIINVVTISTTQKGLTFRYSVDKHMPCEMFGDCVRIRQILLNLLGNAVKFTNKGYVSLVVSSEKISDNQVRITMKVSDTGIGIKEEDIDKIFDNFTQLDTKKNREIQGTGLGLGIAKKMANLLDGDITVESEYGKGSVFTATIIQKVLDFSTIEEKPKTNADVRREECQSFTSPDTKVLIVDDNIVNLKVARGMLELYGFDIDSATSGKEALEKVGNDTYDIIFMDHMMPEMDGVETVRHLREEGCKSTIIALTANAFAEVREMFLNNGFQDFISKPIEQAALYKVLDRWVEEDKKVWCNGEKTANKTIDNSTNIVYNEKSEYSESTKKLQILNSSAVDGLNYIEGVKKNPKGTDGYLELLEMYYLDGQNKIKLIEQLVLDKDFDRYIIEVHALKSASYNICANELGDEAKKHEFAGKDKEYDFIIKNYKQLIEHYEFILDGIEKVLDKVKELEREKKAKQPKKLISNGEIILILNDVLADIDNFKSKDAMSKLDVLLSFNLEEKIEDSVSEIKDKLKMYDDDSAEDILKQMLEIL